MDGPRRQPCFGQWDTVYVEVSAQVARMPETKIAKLFENGTSQAVSLPAGFEFEGEEVFATRNDVTGDVVLSSRPGAAAWRVFYEMMESVEIPADFMAVRPMNAVAAERNVFGNDV